MAGRLQAFLTRQVSAPHRLAGTMWGIFIVLSVTGSVGALVDAKAAGGWVVLLSGLGALAAWSIVEAGVALFQGLLDVADGQRKRSGLGLNAVAHGLVLFVGAAPLLIPLLVLSAWPMLALRVSNGVALIELALVGWQAGRMTGGRPVIWSLCLVAASALIVGIILVLEELG